MSFPLLPNGNVRPRVSLLGAGPGDPELITLKGVRVLSEADVVLYDALVSEEVLQLVPPGVLRISVGKRSGMHTHGQDEINAMIVEYAYQYGHVVRLKGGDPFVFGRGHEELEYAEAHGVEVDIVPGISSALAVPASVRIPLTKRGVSESFWVVTGTTRTGALSDDISLAAQSTATVVILMGMRRIREIMAVFAEHGKTQSTVAIIQNGTMPNERWLLGTVQDIADRVREDDVASPAIILVGEVARYASKPNIVEVPEEVRQTA